ncbi:hypothetical protein BGZ73_002310 [Actinomortierella ambigua]|nr:hypothetical protein BGZ73_002310 [Actinomortierella ambigua]
MNSTADLPKAGLAGKALEKKPGSDRVIRYSQEFLLACAKSPLVERPTALPPTSEWFGELVKEEVDSNRRTPGRSGTSDKIILGPPKTNFASSSLGGLRRSDDGSNGTKKTGEGVREPRAPRGPSSALEHGFARETIEKLASHKLLPKVTPKDITGLLSGMNSRTTSRTTLSSSQKLSGGRNLNSSNSTPGNGFNTNNNISNSNATHSGLRTHRSDAPEWMTYDPDAQSSSRETNGDGPQDFVDDIQAWKARMKEHERREREKEAAAATSASTSATAASAPSKDRDPKQPSRADTSTSWRASAPPAKAQDTPSETSRSGGARPLVSTSMQDIDLLFASGDIDLMKPLDPTSSAFDKFLSQHTLAAAETGTMGLTPRRTDGGSRFARFFDDEPEMTGPSTTHAAPATGLVLAATAPAAPAQGSAPVPGRQLSLDQLFQAHSLGGTGSASGSVADQGTMAAQTPPAPGRMLSEADILAAMSRPKPVATATHTSDTRDEDAFAFSKIMSALSKPPVREAEDARQAVTSPRQEATAKPVLGPEVPAAPQMQSPIPQDPSIIMVHSKPPITSAQTVTLDALKSISLGGQTTSTSTHAGPEVTGAAPVDGHGDMSVSTEESASAPSSASTSGSVSALDSTLAPVPSATSPAASAPPASSGATPKTVAKPVHLAFAGGVPTSVYRQLSGKGSEKAGSPLVRPLSTGPNTLNGSASPSLSSPSIQSPHPSSANQGQPAGTHTHALPTSQPPGLSQGQQGSPSMSKSFTGISHQPMPHSPGMDPRLSGNMYPNMMHPPPHYGPGPNPSQPDGYFHGMPMQRPPLPFVSQMPPFSQPGGSGSDRFMSPPPHPHPHPSQMHHHHPHSQQGGEFGSGVHPPPPHGGPHGHPHPGPFPNQFVGNMPPPPPFGGPPPPMHHPGMMAPPPPPSMNPVEALLHRGPPGGGPPGPGGMPGPNHFVPANFGHPMLSPHGNLPMNPPFFPPQGAKPMMNREEFERHHVPQ